MTETEILTVIDTASSVAGFIFTPEQIDQIVAELETLDTNPSDNELGPFSSDSETSRQAALDNYPRSGSQRWGVLAYVQSQGTRGATRDEIARELGLPDSSTDARVWELLKGSWILETDKVRKTQNGSDAKVLVITNKTRMYNV